MPEDPFGLVGTAIDHKYRIDELVGEGGFGVVYRGFHQSFEQPIAVKCLKVPAHFTTEAAEIFLKRFRDEGKHLAKLSEHPSIVRAYDFGVATSIAGASVPYLVLEWLDGMDLKTLLAQRSRRGVPPFTEAQAIRFLRPAVGAMAFAHRLNVAHRDIKPANLFLASTARGTALKILDFGIAKAMQEGDTVTELATQTSSGYRAFSPQYGAPEQFQSKKYGPTGPWTDVYALTLVLVELVVGRRALEGNELVGFFLASIAETRPTPRNLGAQVSDAFEQLCAQALRRAPRNRLRNARALLTALDATRDEPAEIVAPDPVAPAPDARSNADSRQDGGEPAVDIAPQPSSAVSSAPAVAGSGDSHSEPTAEVAAVEPPPPKPAVAAVASSSPPSAAEATDDADPPGEPSRPSAKSAHEAVAVEAIHEPTTQLVMRGKRRRIGMLGLVAALGGVLAATTAVVVAVRDGEANSASSTTNDGATQGGAPMHPDSAAAHALLAQAKTVARTDINRAHELLQKIPEGSPARTSQDFRTIEAQWADSRIDDAETAEDLEEKQRILEEVSRASSVDAERRKRAADALVELLQAEADEPATETAAPEPAHHETQAPAAASAASETGGTNMPPTVRVPDIYGDDLYDEDAQRRVLEPKVWSGQATRLEIRKLRAICINQGDRACRRRCDRMLGIEYAKKPGGNRQRDAGPQQHEPQQYADDARRQALEQKVWSGQATRIEIRELRLICSYQGDQACRDRCTQLLKQK